jgi:hypothetical protein
MIFLKNKIIELRTKRSEVKEELFIFKRKVINKIRIERIVILCC